MNLSQLYFGSILSATDPVSLFNLLTFLTFFDVLKTSLEEEITTRTSESLNCP